MSRSVRWRGRRKLSIWRATLRTKVLVAAGFLQLDAWVRCICLRGTVEAPSQRSELSNVHHGRQAFEGVEEIAPPPHILNGKAEYPQHRIKHPLRFLALILGAIALCFAMLAGCEPSERPPSDPESALIEKGRPVSNA